MSTFISKILDNITTRIMFIIYVMIILVTVFFITFGYFNQLSLQEERQYDKLKAIVTSIAINIEGDQHELLMSIISNKEPQINQQQDSIYSKINNQLSQAVELNSLNSAMYTLVYSQEQDVFKYGVRSDDYKDLNNEYKQYPPVLKEKMAEGGTIPMYTSENGIWLSAFHPIHNSNGEVVAILEADIDFSEFKELVNTTYLNQAIIAIIVILFIAILLLPYSRRILIADEKKKKLFLKQKLLLEESNKEIKASISYAKRIQSAILPSIRVVKENLELSFILYKPKDIVAGDFYWMEPFINESNSKGVLFAACDCTGHGVPGAMVSVICNNALNRAVREFKLTAPGEILDKTREIVMEEFEKSDDEVKDGMDISLASFEYLESGNQRKAIIKWAGANNPLWILKKDDEQMTEVKPDKQPIGKYDRISSFTTHEIILEKEDIVYLFTDGYQDQFGGVNEINGKEGGKKLKAAVFKKLLISLRNEPIEKQKDLIDNYFETWKGNLDQVDDVCVIGVKI